MHQDTTRKNQKQVAAATMALLFGAITLTGCIFDSPPKREYHVLSLESCTDAVDKVTYSDSTQVTAVTFEPCQVTK